VLQFKGEGALHILLNIHSFQNYFF
jgi:hypothetical protein